MKIRLTPRALADLDDAIDEDAEKIVVFTIFHTSRASDYTTS